MRLFAARLSSIAVVDAFIADYYAVEKLEVEALLPSPLVGTSSLNLNSLVDIAFVLKKVHNAKDKV